MNTDKLFTNKEFLEKELNFFINKKHIKIIQENKELVQSHITKDEAKLLNELSINKEDAELYTNLKDDRHSASYATNIKFTRETIVDYENKVLDFINKTEELIQT